MGSFDSWLNYLRDAEKISLLNGKVRKLHYKFPDGKQMVEEYNMETGVVTRRAWRKCKQLMREPEWEVECGENTCQILNGQAMRSNNNHGLGNDDTTSDVGGEFVMRESISSPILSKRLTKKNIEWRIRNMPWPLDVYNVQVDPTKRMIIVRTTNKKYYKEIPIPDLERCGVLPEQSNLTVHHQQSTLILTYRKPEKLCEMDAAVLMLLKEVPTESDVDLLMKNILY